jgi:hypothetical protein
VCHFYNQWEWLLELSLEKDVGFDGLEKNPIHPIKGADDEDY